MTTNVVSAERKDLPPKRNDSSVLAIGGALLLLVAAFFTWQELHLATEVMAVGAAALAAGVAWLGHKKQLAALGPVALGVAGVLNGVWYAASKEPVLLVGLGITFVASLLTALASQRKALDVQVHRAAAWFSTAATGLASSFALYFFVFDASDTSLQGFVARRALLTLAWLGTGTAMVVAGSKRAANEVRNAGYLVLGTSLVKMLLYDVGHDDGMLRIVALVIGGVVLVGASRLAAMFSAKKEAS
ncbi:MAG: hypothetical protein JNK82_25190 [Myxococcaceae bacterium]|nr:hypothetical protein [Myxococcaceae bacterium]